MATSMKAAELVKAIDVLPIVNSGLLRSTISNCSSGLATIPTLDAGGPLQDRD